MKEYEYNGEYISEEERLLYIIEYKDKLIRLYRENTQREIVKNQSLSDREFYYLQCIEDLEFLVCIDCTLIKVEQ